MSKHIYELRMRNGDDWIPFYVGQSNNIQRRLKEHTQAAKRGEQLLVYQCIRQIMESGIEWDLFSVQEYTEEDLGSYENDRIIDLLRDGFVLMNMKKGSANWLATRQDIADGMNARGLPKGTTEKQYREILTAELLAERHRQWVIEGERKKQAEIDRQLRLQREEEARIRSEQHRKQKELLDRIRAQKKADEVRRDKEWWDSLSSEQKSWVLNYKEAIEIYDTYGEKTALKMLYISRKLHYIIPLTMETVDWHMEIAQSVNKKDTLVSLMRCHYYAKR